MKYRKDIVFLVLVICGLILTACDKQATTPEKIEPIHLEMIDGTDRHNLTLTERAAQRLDIQTTQIVEVIVDETTYLEVPYSTLIYDLDGEVWIYINSKELTYHREKVEVGSIDGDSVYLTAGPPPGTHVVTVGVAELYGSDTGVGK